MRVFIDLTEFLESHKRTGIQRVCGELCRNWPNDVMLTPVKLTHDGRLVPLPEQTLGLIRDYFEATGDSVTDIESQLTQLNEQAEFGRTVELKTDCRILVPELFYDPKRVAFFCSLGHDEFQHCYFIVHDLLLFTHPEFFVANPYQEIINGYIRVLRSARNIAFVSKRTRDAYYRRLMRYQRYSGPVFRLGSDGLGDRPDVPGSRSRRPKFAALGTIEPRKNHPLILDVFEPLLRQIEGLRLTFLGQLGWVDSVFAERVKRMAAGEGSGFEHHSSPSDALIRQYVLESWATIYISEAEGFGLPPVESLWLGTPVIASASIPSLEGIRSAGVHIVEPLNAYTLKDAVLTFLDDSYVSLKAREARELNLSTWRSFAREVADWCSEARVSRC